jgi:hypothetical protein
MLYAGSGCHILSDTRVSYQLADSRLKAIIREWLSLRTVSLKQVTSRNGGLTPGELKHKFGSDTGLYCFSGTMLGCVLEFGGLVKQINGLIPYLKTNLKLDKSTSLKKYYEYIDLDSEEEEVDSSKRCSAAKYYTTSFPCHVFKEHFGDGSNTYSKMVDSWQRFTDIGVKINKVRVGQVYCDVPDQFVEEIPSFIQRWIPEPMSIVPPAIHLG